MVVLKICSSKLTAITDSWNLITLMMLKTL